MRFEAGPRGSHARGPRAEPRRRAARGLTSRPSPPREMPDRADQPRRRVRNLMVECAATCSSVAGSHKVGFGLGIRARRAEDPQPRRLRGQLWRLPAGTEFGPVRAAGPAATTWFTKSHMADARVTTITAYRPLSAAAAPEVHADRPPQAGQGATTPEKPAAAERARHGTLSQHKKDPSRNLGLWKCSSSRRIIP